MTKIFTAREIAQIKRTAQNVAPFMSKIERLKDKVSDLQLQIASLEAQANAWEAGVKAMTGGYTSAELVNRVVTETTNEEGKVTKVTTYVLKYPETVVPMPSPGSDLGYRFNDEPCCEGPVVDQESCKVFPMTTVEE